MRPDEREALRVRFGSRCGYCGVSDVDVGSELTVDHFQPRSHGGGDEPDNWVYCCHACNEYKGDYWQPESPEHILHPLRDDLTEHIAERDDGTLEALSESGVFHIQRLRLNRPRLVTNRRRRRLYTALRHAQAAILDHLSQEDQALYGLAEALKQLGREELPTQ
jgi:hypothetical protein